jgi:hypothetical protein
MTADELQTAKDNLQKAIYSGALEVRFGERWIKFQSTTDMRKALADLNNAIDDISQPGTWRSMSRFAQFNG